MFINSVRYFLLIVVSLLEVHCQLCNTRIIVTRNVLVTYKELTLWGTKIGQKWVTKSEPKEIQKCCDGYRQQNFYSTVVCKPICKSNCTNGYCEKPEVCACNAGYTKRYNTCVPVCEADCLHGTCDAPDTCLCHSGYNLVNGTCQPNCRYPCGNGTCVSDFCYCFPGFQINYLRHYGHEVGPVCEPICKDCAKKQKRSRSIEDMTTTTNNPFIKRSTYNNYEYHTEATTTTTKDPHIRMTTYNNYKYHTEDTKTSTKDPRITMTTYNNYKYHTDDITTTTKDPRITMTTYNNYKYHTDDTTTTTKDPRITMTTYNNYKYHTEDTTTSTTTTPNFMSTIGSTSISSSAETVLDNDSNNNVTSTDMIKKTWMQQHGMCVWIPILLILSTALILLLVWQGAPMVIINFYKGIKNRKSYNVQGAFRKQSASEAFERSCLEFIPNERGAQS